MARKRKIKITRLLIVAGIVLLPIVLLLSFFIPKDTWDSAKFVKEDGWQIYADEKYRTIRGIDVSSHQGKIDWKQVKASGIEFAMIRCGYRGGTEGHQHKDVQFEANMNGAIRNKMDVGVYYYCSAINMEELEKDAQLVLDMVKGYTLTYPIAFDMEIYDEQQGRINSLTVEEKTKMALRFCEIMEEHGYSCMIYGNQNWLLSHLDYEQIQHIPLWYAGYVQTPLFKQPFKIWQFTNEGSVPGIDGYVDLDVCVEKI